MRRFFPFLLAVFAVAAAAQDYPVKPVRMEVGKIVKDVGLKVE